MRSKGILKHALRAGGILLTCLAVVPAAGASHLSGGEPDLLAVFAGVGLVLAFVGILHLLDLGFVHGPRGRRLGWVLVGLSILVVLAGAVTIIWLQAADYAEHAAERAANPAEAAPPPDFWLQTILPLLAVALIASLGAGTAIWWASRSGQFENAEDIKYRVLRDE